MLRVAKAYLKQSNRTFGTFIPTTNPDRAEIPATPDLAADAEGLQGRRSGFAGRDIRPDARRISRRGWCASRCPNGMKVVLLPKKTRGGTVTAQSDHPLRRREVGLRPERRPRIADRQHADARHQEQTRQQIQDEMDKLKAQINVSGGVTSANASIDHRGSESAGGPAARRRDSARARVPRKRVRAGPPAAHRRAGKREDAIRRRSVY